MTAVEVSGVSKVFNKGRPDEVSALHDIDLVVDSGQFVSLIGPSGCGKSTLLRLIADLVPPSSGTVTVAGKPARRARLDQEYGIAFQQAGLFDWRTVRRNVELPLELRGHRRAERRARADEMLELVGLSDFASHYPAQLSGGMQQRVAIARALAVHPPLLLMDEPFGALDPLTRAEVRREFRRLQQQLRKTVIIVTHDLAEAFALGQRVGVLDRGELVVYDTPDRVAVSDDPRVRAFVDASPAVPPSSP
jgi:NitT/TauT family transport system ATP-binding protein